MCSIHYRPSPITPNTYRTQRFGNLLSDTYQGEVYLSEENGWCGFFFNWSRKNENKFRLNFKSRSAASRWVNDKLRKVGVWA